MVRSKRWFICEQPPGYEQRDPKRWVWQLNKALYGTKQAPREARNTLLLVFKKLGVQPLGGEPNFYVIHKDGLVMLMANFVDDTLCGVTTSEKGMELKRLMLDQLGEYFEMDVTDEPVEFLSFEISRDRKRRRLEIGQINYLERLLARHQMSDCKSLKVPWVRTPIKFGTVL